MTPVAHHESADLTARARIRDAALEQFGEQGVKAASMRAIAARAGVSLGLVHYHFRSKEALRAACDELVVDVFGRHVLDLHEQGRIAGADAMGELFSESPLLLRYISQVILEDSPAARTIFDRLADGAEEFLSSSWPERFARGSDRARDAATMMAAMHLSPALLMAQISRRLGLSREESLHSARMPVAMLDVYSAIGDYADSETGRAIRETVEDLGRDASDRPHRERGEEE